MSLGAKFLYIYWIKLREISWKSGEIIYQWTDKILEILHVDVSHPVEIQLDTCKFETNRENEYHTSV